RQGAAGKGAAAQGGPGQGQDPGADHRRCEAGVRRGALDRQAAVVQHRDAIAAAASSASARRSILLVPVSGSSALKKTRRGCCTGGAWASANSLISASPAV